jgi:hypothetical protein
VFTFVLVLSGPPSDFQRDLSSVEGVLLGIALALANPQTVFHIDVPALTCTRLTIAIPSCFCLALHLFERALAWCPVTTSCGSSGTKFAFSGL